MIVTRFQILIKTPSTSYLNHFRKMSEKVFVYGTLKKKEPNHYWLTDSKNGVSKFIANGQTCKKYPLIIGTKYNIPFVLYKPGVGHHVQGEVYEVDEKMMSNLDKLEDHPNYYIREIDDIDIKRPGTTENERIKCWVYFMKNFKEELLFNQMFENYSSTGSHGLPYLERSQREKNYDHFSAIKK
ncbi:PREDICTED: putative gamma-glutamylcyclotransferase CG2811 isoform X2 [Papilio polytes]|uniref:putative gamma-glutamylcyclotransferase CG2811 isoform X2 n=2 Tax=Papilio polytes TaxID=76194 RepID=UPI0006764E84|nr:PREDICTED: putative gamma-glutamylcyclotransferase CG2811 isoform X2 [Papilio polytes]